MKMTVAQLRKLIKEEANKILKENDSVDMGSCISKDDFDKQEKEKRNKEIFAARQKFLKFVEEMYKYNSKSYGPSLPQNLLEVLDNVCIKIADLDQNLQYRSIITDENEDERYYRINPSY